MGNNKSLPKKKCNLVVKRSPITTKQPDVVRCSRIPIPTKTCEKPTLKCETHFPIKTECQTRLKLIDKGVYSVEKSKFLWKKAYYKILLNFPNRDPIELKEFLETTYRTHRPNIDKCKQAHFIHCAIANYLNLRQTMFCFYN